MSKFKSLSIKYPLLQIPEYYGNCISLLNSVQSNYFLSYFKILIHRIYIS